MGANAKINFMAHDKKISLKIKVDKIDKGHLYKGEKATYLTLTVVPTPNNQYGDDYMVTQYRGRDAESVILGNGRDLNFGNDADSSSAPMPSAMAADVQPKTEDLPF
jgi:hypothetical protein